MSDDDLYDEGVRRMHDFTLLHWYARLDMRSRHRLLAVANERHKAIAVAEEAQGRHPLFVTDTLSAVLMMLLTSDAYRNELLLLQQPLSERLEKALIGSDSSANGEK